MADRRTNLRNLFGLGADLVEPRRVDGTGGMDCAIADPERRAVEHFFRRGIDPVQVFKDHQRRLLP
jgi:hypothetical protein